MAQDTAAQLQALKDKAATADRERAGAEARVGEAKKRLKEIDGQIEALGVKPEDAEAEVAKLEAELARDIAAIDTALDEELAAYRALGG